MLVHPGGTEGVQDDSEIGWFSEGPGALFFVENLVNRL
jgi:hypothetical protein